MTDLPETRADTYVIVLRELLIAQDLAQTITDRDPAARVILAATPDEAVIALSDVARVVVAFVSAAPSEYIASSLGPAIKARRGRVILLGCEAEGVGATQDWDVLPQPFDTNAVLGVLGRVLGQAHSSRTTTASAKALTNAS